MGKKRSVTTAHVSLQRTADSVLIHDIRNLAFRLSALLQNMEAHFENPVFRTNLVEALDDSVRRMNTMVKSYHDHQQQVILKLRINLNDILQSILALLPAGSTRHIHIEKVLAEIPDIWGDSFYLQQAFTNLIQNALDAMPAGGDLRIRTERADTRRSRRVAVEIADTGIGMPREFIESQLFQPFVTTKEQGMGLGLYTMRQIVSLHRGSVKVKSALNNGTTFRIVFPAITDES